MTDRNLFKLALAVILLPAAMAAGCQERYRYPCQDVKNWEKEMCQRPLCEVHKTCPDLIFKNDLDKIELPQYN